MPSSDINVENIKQQKCQSCTDFTINLWEEHSSRNGDGEDSCVYHEFIINNRWVRGVLKIRSLCLCLPFFTQELKIITIHGWSKIDNNACIKCARCHQFLVRGYQRKNQRCEPRPKNRFQLSQFCLWHWQQFQLFFLLRSTWWWPSNLPEDKWNKSKGCDTSQGDLERHWILDLLAGLNRLNMVGHLCFIQDYHN